MGFTVVVNCGAVIYSVGEALELTRRAKPAGRAEPAEGAPVRATITFPWDVYRTLEGIARQRKVSLAWVVREASEQYIADKWPLFKGRV